MDPLQRAPWPGILWQEHWRRCALSARSSTEHPAGLGWEVIDQGAQAIPNGLAASLCDDFREVTLRRVFCETVRGINL